MNNFELEKKARNIPYFRGVFMRDKLPKKIGKKECGIVNLDNIFGRGTHWVAYVKRNSIVKYFDSFGNLQPPKELVKYFGKYKTRIVYNRERYQSFNTTNCGKLCLNFLKHNVLM